MAESAKNLAASTREMPTMRFFWIGGNEHWAVFTRKGEGYGY